MGRAESAQWLSRALWVALLYPVIGILLALLPASSNTVLVIWRLSAWILCAVAFAVHLGYEHVRFPSSPSQVAGHCALAVALGAFLLAVWVNGHVYWIATSDRSPLAPLALVVFPVVTGVPAFVVALIIAVFLQRMRRRGQ